MTTSRSSSIVVPLGGTPVTCPNSFSPRRPDNNKILIRIRARPERGEGERGVGDDDDQRRKMCRCFVCFCGREEDLSSFILQQIVCKVRLLRSRQRGLFKRCISTTRVSLINHNYNLGPLIRSKRILMLPLEFIHLIEQNVCGQRVVVESKSRAAMTPAVTDARHLPFVTFPIRAPFCPLLWQLQYLALFIE